MEELDEEERLTAEQWALVAPLLAVGAAEDVAS